MDLNNVFNFYDSDEVSVSKGFIENSDDKKEIVLKKDIILPPSQITYYNTGITFTINPEFKQYGFRVHFYQCDLAFEKYNYIVYDNIYEENMKIKIYIRNLLNTEQVVKQNTVLGNFYLVVKNRSFFEIYSELKEEHLYKVKYKYNDLLIKDKNDKITNIIYTENIIDGNSLVLKLKS